LHLKFEIKGAKKGVADHLSWLLIDQEGDGGHDLPIDDFPPDEHLFALATFSIPWYTDRVNYLVCGIVPPNLDFNQKKWLFSQVMSYY